MSRLRKSDRGIDSPEESETDRKRGGEHDSHLMEPRGRMRFSGKGERMGESIPGNVSYSIWEKSGIFTPHLKIMSSELRA